MRRDDRKSFIPGPQILRSLFPLLPVCFFLSALCGDYRLQWSRRSLLLSFVSGSPRKDTTVVSSQSATATATAPKSSIHSTYAQLSRGGELLFGVGDALLQLALFIDPSQNWIYNLFSSSSSWAAFACGGLCKLDLKELLFKNFKPKTML